MRAPKAAALLLGALLPAAAASATTTSVVDLPSGGGTQRFLYVRPDAPIANLVHVPGGDGVLGIQANGAMNTATANCSPVVRNRVALADRGIALALVDANTTGVVRDFDDVAGVVRYMQARNPVPTWVIGGSASTGVVANLGVNLPATDAVGVVFYSPAAEDPTFLARLRRPTLVTWHSADPNQSGNRVYNALTSAVVRERAVFSGGSSAGCGFHLFNGLDTEFVATVAGFVERNNAATQAVAPNYQGLWWKSPAGSESGWGVNLTHQGDTLFATWFTYDTDGRGMWLVMSNGERTGAGTYSGALYRTTGPAFSANAFNPAQVTVTAVGSATFTFTDSGNGTFAYVVNGVSQSKAITRQVYSTPVPECTAGGAHGASPNYQALWWASPMGSESGWGINVTHQGDILFATWFTYDTDGRGLWLVMSNGARTAAGTYSGTLYRTTGPPFSANPWPGGVAVTEAGTATFSFTGAEAGTFTFTVGGLTRTKQIARQVFASPATVCR